MADVANLIVQISADSAKMNAELASAKSKVENFASGAINSIKGIAAIIATTFAFKEITDGISSTIDQLEELNASATKFGVSLDQFQKLKYQAEAAHVPVEALSTALKFLQKNIGLAAEGGAGSKPLQEAFSRIGQVAAGLKFYTPDQQFYQVAQALKSITDQTELAAVASKIFGKSYSNILPLIRSDLSKTGADFQSINGQISKDQQKGIEDFEQMRTKAKEAYNDIKLNAVANALPAFKLLNASILDTINNLGGVKIVGLEVAIVLVKGMSAVYSIMSEIRKEFVLIVNTASALKDFLPNTGKGIGQALHELNNPQEGLKSPGLDPFNPNNYVQSTNYGTQANSKNIDAVVSSIKDLGSNSNIAQKMSQLAADLESQLRNTPKSTISGAISDSASTQHGGLGYIQNLKTGQIYTTNLPKQQVDVNATVDVKVNQNFLDVIDTRIDKKINDASRGSAR